METKVALKREKVLIIDDEPGIRQLLQRELSLEGYDVQTAEDGVQALEKVQSEKFQLAVCDMNMPRLGGLDVLEALRDRDPDMEVIMMTGYATVETAVQAMKKGAYDFVQKPFSLDELLMLVEKSLEKQNLKLTMAVYEASRLIFRSIKLDALLPLIAQLSLKILDADDVSIMTSDESGKLSLKASARRTATASANGGVDLEIAGKVTEWREPMVITNPANVDARLAGLAGLASIKSSIVHPLFVDNQLVGVINFNRTRSEKPFVNTDLRIATIFASQVAQAIHNANLYRRLEEKQSQLVQSEKLASIGMLTAGIAHELNNPLSGIMGFAQLLLEDVGLSARQREDIKTISDESVRCRNIIRNLLMFSRSKHQTLEPVALVPLINATTELFRYEFSSAGITIEKDFEAGVPDVLGDASQLQQVFINLITNAQHALDGIPDPRLKIQVWHQEGHVSLRFIDNGVGIEKKALGRVFDPFFTTKPVGKGTGLGLSICYGIVTQHHGTVRVESEAGNGATMIVELPAHE